MDQAKWYVIRLNSQSADRYGKELRRIRFYKRVLLFLCKEDGIKRIKDNGFHIYYQPWGLAVDYDTKIFCGKKKLNKVIREINLLGLQDKARIY